MDEKINFYGIVDKICLKDARYKPESYLFLMQGLRFTQGRFKKEGHLSGRELLEGLRQFAIEQYGPLAERVLNHWGISSTLDFGNIVFNLIEKKVLSRTDEDSLEDFRDAYDFKKAFANILRDSIIRDMVPLKTQGKTC